MPANTYAKCRGCDKRRRDGWKLSRNGWCVECARSRVLAIVDACHPGAGVDTRGPQGETPGGERVSTG